MAAGNAVLQLVLDSRDTHQVQVTLHFFYQLLGGFIAAPLAAQQLPGSAHPTR